MALNQLLNIVTYYNSKVEEPDDLYINGLYTIVYNAFYKSYTVSIIGSTITSVTVNSITILDAVEIIPCTDKAIESIEGVKEWKY